MLNAAEIELPFRCSHFFFFSNILTFKSPTNSPNVHQVIVPSNLAFSAIPSIVTQAFGESLFSGNKNHETKLAAIVALFFFFFFF